MTANKIDKTFVMYGSSEKVDNKWLEYAPLKEKLSLGELFVKAKKILSQLKQESKNNNKDKIKNNLKFINNSFKKFSM